jgi:hypothetical protein
MYETKKRKDRKRVEVLCSQKCRSAAVDGLMLITPLWFLESVVSIPLKFSMLYLLKHIVCGASEWMESQVEIVGARTSTLNGQ